MSGRCPHVTNWLDSGEDGADCVSKGISTVLGGEGVGEDSLCEWRFKDLLSLVDKPN